jgi:hypothetical protein
MDDIDYLRLAKSASYLKKAGSLQGHPAQY